MLMMVAFCVLVLFLVVTWGFALHAVERLMLENRKLQESVDYWFNLAVEQADRESVDIYLPEPPPAMLVIKGEHGFVVFDQ